jgi:glycosyltransferase involved in cell wall biosynthesis
MAEQLPADVRRAAESIGRADIVIGIPSYNNGRTIGHVVQAANAGLMKYFPQLIGVVVNSDGGSTDNTRDEVLSASVDETHLMLLSTPLAPVQRLSVPYHGIPGKGSAFRLIFQLAEHLQAKACAVVDSDLRSITPEWINLLLRPILSAEFDFVAPYYHRHKYDGTITNSIVYPLTRARYGLRVRQPIGGEFGMSARLVARYLKRDDWETDVARYGIDIWMTTIAIAEGFRVCQSFLGAKLHDAKDPSSDLSAMLQQVVGSVFLLMKEYQSAWQNSNGSKPVPLFGFRYDVGLDPIEVNVERMVKVFCRGSQDLGEIWAMALQPDTYAELRELGNRACTGAATFHFDDGLWAKVILDFACAYNKNPLSSGQLLQSLTPLYLARVASFVQQTYTLGSVRVEEDIEQLCLTFEALKPYLFNQWVNQPSPAAEIPVPAVAERTEQVKLEV